MKPNTGKVVWVDLTHEIFTEERIPSIQVSLHFYQPPWTLDLLETSDILMPESLEVRL